VPGVSNQVTIGSGVFIKNLSRLNGPIFLTCNSIGSPSLEFDNGRVFILQYGAGLSNTPTATHPCISVNQQLVLAASYGAVVSNTNGTDQYPIVNVPENGVLIWAVVINTNPTAWSNHIISSTDNTATMIKLFDASMSENEIDNTESKGIPHFYQGVSVYSPVDKSDSVKYVDSVISPDLGATTVQAAIDKIKNTYLPNPLTADANCDRFVLVNPSAISVETAKEFTIVAGASSPVRIIDNTIGFYGVYPIAQRARPVTLQDVIDTLVALGLCS
jgi:hypothetical protein